MASDKSDQMPGDEISEPVPEEGRHAPDDEREGDEQDYIDRDKIDFDPDDGLLSGTAIDGTSDIPGPHEDEGGTVEENDAREDEPDASASDASDSTGDTGDSDDDEGSGDSASSRSEAAES